MKCCLRGKLKKGGKIQTVTCVFLTAYNSTTRLVTHGEEVVKHKVKPFTYKRAKKVACCLSKVKSSTKNQHQNENKLEVVVVQIVNELSQINNRWLPLFNRT